MSRIHRCKVVGLSLSRATKSRFHREKTEHVGDGDRDMSRHHLCEQDVQYEFSKGSKHWPVFCAIVTEASLSVGAKESIMLFNYILGCIFERCMMMVRRMVFVVYRWFRKTSTSFRNPC